MPDGLAPIPLVGMEPEMESYNARTAGRASRPIRLVRMERKMVCQSAIASPVNYAVQGLALPDVFLSLGSAGGAPVILSIWL
jgi:hypothetical protein